MAKCPDAIQTLSSSTMAAEMQVKRRLRRASISAFHDDGAVCRLFPGEPFAERGPCRDNAAGYAPEDEGQRDTGNVIDEIVPAQHDGADEDERVESDEGNSDFPVYVPAQ